MFRCRCREVCQQVSQGSDTTSNYLIMLDGQYGVWVRANKPTIVIISPYTTAIMFLRILKCSWSQNGIYVIDLS